MQNYKLLNLIYPEKCVVCHQILTEPGGERMCRVCRTAILPVTEPRCKRCSKPLIDLEAELCENCRSHEFCVDRGFALYPYNERMQKAIRNLKYRGELAGGEYFADQMSVGYGAWVRRISPDVLIPVPIHKRRMRFRGFNQAACLAVRIGQRLGVAVDLDYLARTGNTKPQKGLGGRARINNLQKSFSVVGENAAYRNILLIDDIYTTGATLEACGRILREAGAKRIYFLCLCIGSGD